MAVVSFTLSEEAVAALRDALICLNKFSDDVSFEAQKDKVCFLIRLWNQQRWPGS